MGRTIDDLGAGLDRLPPECRAKRVIVVTLTDGMENASQSYSSPRVREMIRHQEQVYSWQFLFLGANFDAVSVGQDLGIPVTHAAKAHDGPQGISMAFASLSRCMSDYRNDNAFYYCNLSTNADWGGDPNDKSDLLRWTNKSAS
jgi:hypothetical protein